MAKPLFENEYLGFLSRLSSGSPKLILKDIHNFFGKFFSFDFSGLFLCKDKNSKLVLLPECEDNNLDGNLPEKEIIHKLKKNNKPLIYPLDKDGIFLREFERKYKDKFNFINLLPLEHDNDFLGVLFFYSHKKIIINEKIEEILSFICVYISLLFKNKYYYDKMEQRLAELLTLQNVSDFVNSTLDFEKLLDVALDAIVGLIGLRTCSITIFTDKLFNDVYSRCQKSLVNTVDISKEVEIDLSEGLYLYLSQKRSPVSGITKVSKDILNIISFDSIKEGDEVQYIIIPISRGNELYGSINIFDPTLIHLDNIESHFLESFANQFSIALQNANLYRKQAETAKRDGLTSLYNHAYFQNTLDLLIKQGNMFPLSLIFMDIDDFKQVNDQYGHLIGDKVLKELSGILLKHTRDGDLVARYGGEEFAILLPKTKGKKALEIASRLREFIASNSIYLDNQKAFRITVSIGISEYKKGWKKEYFIEIVDQLLYKAKHNGKNRVEMEL